MHEGNFLFKSSDTLWSGAALPLPNPAKLAIVCIETEKTLTRVSPETGETIKRFTHVMLQSLHPAGSIAVAIPHPWSIHSFRIQGKVATVLVWIDAMPMCVIGNVGEVRCMAFAHCYACLKCKRPLALLLKYACLLHPCIGTDTTTP